MKPFQVLEHSGDLKIRAFGESKEEALVNAVHGLLCQIMDVQTISEAESSSLKISDPDDTTRAVDFLNEVVYLIFGEHWLPKKIRRLTICGSGGCDTIKAELSGEPYDPSRHHLKLEIKAVTFHDFSIEHQSGLVRITFLCDL